MTHFAQKTYTFPFQISPSTSVNPNRTEHSRDKIRKAQAHDVIIEYGSKKENLKNYLRINSYHM